MKCKRNKMYRSLFSGIAILVLLLSGCAPAKRVLQKKCISSSQVYEKGTGIAVWDFEINSLTDDVHMNRFLSDKIIKRILKERHYDLITRDHLLLILQEINLGTSMLVDERTRLKIGKLAGVKLMVFGWVQQLPDNSTLIKIDLLEVETGKTLNSVGKRYDVATYDLSEWLKTVEELTPELFIICQ
jgi:hypothetical protein